MSGIADVKEEVGDEKGRRKRDRGTKGEWEVEMEGAEREAKTKNRVS